MGSSLGKILIIDDEDDLRFLLAERLKKVGYEALEASGGLKGLEIARKEQPDLVLLDIMMPNMTGYQVWTEFQKDEALKDIPIIVVSAKMKATDNFWGPRMPSEDFFTKPYDENLLLKRIAKRIKDAWEFKDEEEA